MWLCCDVCLTITFWLRCCKRNMKTILSKSLINNSNKRSAFNANCGHTNKILVHIEICEWARTHVWVCVNPILFWNLFHYTECTEILNNPIAVQTLSILYSSQMAIHKIDLSLRWSSTKQRNSERKWFSFDSNRFACFSTETKRKIPSQFKYP